MQSLHAAAHPDLFKPGGGGTFPPDTIRERMATPGHEFLVAIDDGRVVGYAYLITMREPETPWRHASSVLTVDQMAVTEPLRGRGAGTALLDAARARGAAIGASELRLSVWTFNTRARALYERYGFTAYQERLRLRV